MFSELLRSLANHYQTIERRYEAEQHCKVKRYCHHLTWAYTLEGDFDFEWYFRFWDIAKDMGLKPFHLPDIGMIDGAYHHLICISGDPATLDEFTSIMWYGVDIRGIELC